MPHWKEQFDRFMTPPFYASREEIEAITDFISTEVVAKLIDEIPEGIRLKPAEHFKSTTDIKQQLRDKWL